MGVHVITDREQKLLDKLSNVIYDKILDGLDVSEVRAQELAKAMINAGKKHLEEGN